VVLRSQRSPVLPLRTSNQEPRNLKLENFENPETVTTLKTSRTFL
jgi:hypothetical protein